MTDTERKKKAIINTVYYGMLIAAAVFAVRLGLGLFFPIIVAFFFAMILQRPKNFLVTKTPFRKGFAAVICVFFTMALVTLVMALVGVRVVDEIKGFIDYMIIRLQDIDSVANAIETAVYNFIGRLPAFVEGTLRESATALFTQVREYLAGQTAEIPEQIGSLGNMFDFSWITKPLSGVVSTASKVPSFLIAFLVCVITTCFMTADYDIITDFINAQLSEKKRVAYQRGKTLLKSSLGKMGKAYILIILITFSEMLIGLSLLKILGVYNAGYIVIISIVTAIIDVIPVLGTGTILIPWTAINLLLGNYPMAIGTGVMYVTITIIRQIIEPKLVGGQLGLPSFVTIAAMYIGLKTMGVMGVFIAPLIIIMLKLLNDEGIIHLWKTTEKEDLIKEETKENTEQN